MLDSAVDGVRGGWSWRLDRRWGWSLERRRKEDIPDPEPRPRIYIHVSEKDGFRRRGFGSRGRLLGFLLFGRWGGVVFG